MNELDSLIKALKMPCKQPKVKRLVNTRYYDKSHINGIPISMSNFNPKQNSIFIKGNNLDALSTLLPIYRGKVKMIYIDPPYNTGNDSFNYNDSFNQSSWLTFIKNRLDVAKQFLRPDGSIFISCDDNEQAYLKVLCDEIFGRDNFIANITDVNNLKGNQDQFGFAKTHDYILIYTKNINTAKKQHIFNKLPLSKRELKYWHKDNKGYYKKGANLKSSGDNAPRYKRPHLFYPIYISPNKSIHFQQQSDKDIKLVPISNHQDMSWRWSKKHMANHLSDIIVNKTTNGYSLYKKQRNYTKMPKTLFDNPKYSSGNGTNELKHLFNNKNFLYPKPEELLHDLIQIGTNKHDIVMDFFAGSATTQAVAMKMGRRFIGVEQMNYPIRKQGNKWIKAKSTTNNTVPLYLERLKKVLGTKDDDIGVKNEYGHSGKFVYATLQQSHDSIYKLQQKLTDSTSINQLNNIFNSLPSYLQDSSYKRKRAFRTKYRWLEVVLLNNEHYINK